MDIYFCIKANEAEHKYIEDELRQRCAIHLCKVDFYRPLKDGHINLYKEVRITGPREEIEHVRNFLQGGMNIRFERNPHKKVKYYA